MPEKINTVKDPTGAGDAYITGFVSREMAATAASFAIEHYGTQAHTFTPQGFEKRYQDSFS